MKEDWEGRDRICWTLKACNSWAFGCCNNGCSLGATFFSAVALIVKKKTTTLTSNRNKRTLLFLSGQLSQLRARCCPPPIIKSHAINGKNCEAIYRKLIRDEGLCRARFLTGSTWPWPLPAFPISINMRKVKWSHLMNSSRVSAESIKFIRLAASTGPPLERLEHRVARVASGGRSTRATSVQRHRRMYLSKYGKGFSRLANGSGGVFFFFSFIFFHKYRQSIPLNLDIRN